MKSIASKILLVGVILTSAYYLYSVNTMVKRTQAHALGAGLRKSASEVKWTGCDGKDSYATITGINVLGTFMANTIININMLGTFKQDAQINDVEATIKLGFITVFEDDISFQYSGKAGDPFNQTLGTTIYIDAPSGGYRATLRFRDKDTNVLQCTLVTFKLS